MMDHKDGYGCCVYKASPGGIQEPLYYGTKEDCRRFCEDKDYEYVDEENVVWYLEIAGTVL